MKGLIEWIGTWWREAPFRTLLGGWLFVRTGLLRDSGPFF
jgi:hypothetical protein